MTELERCIEFVCRIADRAAKQKVQSAFGVAQLNDELPRVWSRNVLFASENLEQAEPSVLAAETDRIFQPRGLAHRKVELIDDEVGTRLEPGFRELGWTVQCDVVMVARTAPDRETDTAGVEEVTLEDLVPAWAEGWRTEPQVEDEEVVRQLAENRRVIMYAVDTRFFAARSDGAIASYCELYSDGSTGQIENVFTSERFRNRGLARSTVSRALEESRAAGHDLTFLLADRDDWPKELYRKLGFEQIGQIWEFLRPPGK
jgi:predicted GNAT family acetyltransferase